MLRVRFYWCFICAERSFHANPSPPRVCGVPRTLLPALCAQSLVPCLRAALAQLTRHSCQVQFLGRRPQSLHGIRHSTPSIPRSHSIALASVISPLSCQCLSFTTHHNSNGLRPPRC